MSGRKNSFPISWHGLFFFKAVTGRVEINPAVSPRIRAPTRITRYTSNPDRDHFIFNQALQNNNLSKIGFLTELVEYRMLLLQTLDYLLLALKVLIKLSFTVLTNKLLSLPTSLMTLGLSNLYGWPVTLPII